MRAEDTDPFTVPWYKRTSSELKEPRKKSKVTGGD